MSKLKLLFIFGTRPEAIKMAPLVIKGKELKEKFDIKICITGQHRSMLDQVMAFFELKADYDLDLMRPNQTLFTITADALNKLEPVLDNYKPDYVVVQGDTTTAFTGALAAYYKQVKVIHIEAGLRSGDKLSPFPEEINRRLAGVISDIHFAPTNKAKENLALEHITQNVFVVGNPVIDALLIGLKKVKANNAVYEEQFSYLDSSLKMILVTGHRRESFGEPFKEICYAIKEIAAQPGVEVIYPVHLNPNVQQPVNEILGNISNIHLIAPLPYPELIWLMNKSYIILTDSGGIQEESPTLGKPVLVMRNVTERQEGVDAGTAKLVGNYGPDILRETLQLLQNDEVYNKMAHAANPYGDGTTSEQIYKTLSNLV
ncbi:MAG: UDP-N-acetylglucosamine 2-epimerase (non-hydrolyzing) [Bacteroidota bacterium]